MLMNRQLFSPLFELFSCFPSFCLRFPRFTVLTQIQYWVEQKATSFSRQIKKENYLVKQLRASLLLLLFIIMHSIKGLHD